MKVKQYIFPLLVILAFLGIAHQQQATSPNQEIVLQFKADAVKANDVKAAINLVENQLQLIGVNSFKISHHDNGTLKISYYTNTDVVAIKRLLLQSVKVELNIPVDKQDPLELPSEDDAIAYNIDVFEIDNGINSNSGFDGIIVEDYHNKADRFSKPKDFGSYNITQIVLGLVNSPSKLQFPSTPEIALQQSLHKIPEVRAGPFFA
ncbi:hypothetical protein MHTCC0001_06260 [Flavobacteriaceae bacterium MHTCC 0001]